MAEEQSMKNYDFDTIYDRRGTGCVKTDGLEELFGKSDLLPLWVADMDFAIAPEIQEALEQRLKHPIFGYNYLLPSFYEAAVNWVKNHYNWQIKKEWLLYTPGIVTGINIAVETLTAPGDCILIQTPVYDPFYEAATLHGRRLLTNPLLLKDNRYEIDFTNLEMKLSQAKLFILCNPHNPGGRVWTQDELLAVGRLCAKYNVKVISDEIHADLIYDGYTHTAFASLENFADFCVTCYSPSKSFNLAGLCTSILVIPTREMFQKVEKYIQEMHLYLGNCFGNTALIAAYTKGEDWLHALLSYLQANRDFLKEYLTRNLPAIEMMEPEATFLAWLNCRKLNLNDDELQAILINEAGLALNLGRMYGEEGSGFVRLNFGCPRSLLEKACARLNKAFGRRSKKWN